MRRFFIEQSRITSTKIFITGSDATHIKKVLRMKSGDRIGLFDGRGFEYEARIENLLAGSVEVSITKRFLSVSESPVQIIVAQALLKDKKMDSLARQLTEIGVARLIPFTSIRSVPRPDEKRLSARRKPEIVETTTFNDVIKIDDECELKIVFWENESKPVSDAVQQVHDRHYRKILAVLGPELAVLGPEGGFSEKEIEDARAGGFVTASLGPRILRAETATVAACTILQYIFGDMGLKKS
ncbi:MAG: 16S rRNA (uracil(1498)-N(3))-methyltransferase [Deltaproteobacteria bacterium]|nr:16S rRNA (uracil(1498)-N(3))-methyltransferase [Deltaproteobacteria bacterium]